MFPASCHGDRYLRTFYDLKQGMLYTFSRYISGNTAVFTFSGYFIYFVNINDPALSAFNVIIRCLNQLEQDVFNVLAYIACLGQRCRVGDGKRNIKRLGESLRKQGFAYAGGSQQKHVALGEIHAFIIGKRALVVVVNRHAERDLRVVLTDDILVKNCLDFLWL